MTLHSARGAALILATALLTTGCEPSPSGSFVVGDSAGVQVVEIRAGAIPAQRSMQISPRPVLEIGGQGAPEAEQLHRVSGAVRLNDGTIVVANAGSGELLWFDGTDGILQSRAGGAGEGPGEFELLSWVGSPAGDSVYAWDRGGDFSVFAGGTLVRSARTEQPADDRPLVNARGVLGDGRLVASPSPTWVPPDEAGVQRPPMPFWIVSAEGKRMRELGPFPDEDVYLRPSAGGRGWIRTEVPYGASSLIGVGPDRIAIGDNARYEVRLYTPDGDLRTIVRRMDVDPRPVRPEDLEEELARRLEDLPPVEEIRAGIRAAFERTPPAESMPFYQRLVVDRAGRLWVKRERIAPDRSTPWDVFAPDGHFLGPVDVPAGVEVLEIGEDYLLGLGRDELDVQTVQLFDLARSR